MLLSLGARLIFLVGAGFDEEVTRVAGEVDLRAPEVEDLGFANPFGMVQQDFTQQMGLRNGAGYPPVANGVQFPKENRFNDYNLGR